MTRTRCWKEARGGQVRQWTFDAAGGMWMGSSGGGSSSGKSELLSCTLDCRRARRPQAPATQKHQNADPHPHAPHPTQQMGRMHSGGKGMSSSALPYKRTPPSWAKATPKDVEEHVCKLAKKGLTPSQVSVWTDGLCRCVLG